VEFILNEFKKETGVNLKNDSMDIQCIWEAVENVRIRLSLTAQTEINLCFITTDASGPKHINTTLMCSQFESLVVLLVQQTMDLCKKALSNDVLNPVKSMKLSWLELWLIWLTWWRLSSLSCQPRTKQRHVLTRQSLLMHLFRAVIHPPRM
jgi:Hsp70 protein